MDYTTTNSSGKTMYLVVMASGATCYMTAKARRAYWAKQDAK